MAGARVAKLVERAQYQDQRKRYQIQGPTKKKKYGMHGDGLWHMWGGVQAIKDPKAKEGNKNAKGEAAE